MQVRLWAKAPCGGGRPESPRKRGKGFQEPPCLWKSLFRLRKGIGTSRLIPLGVELLRLRQGFGEQVRR